MKILKKKYIIFYGHYVDDIIIIYNNNLDIANNILDTFNAIHQNIKFTTEKQKKYVKLSRLKNTKGKTTNHVQQKLKNLNHKTDKLSNSGIYQLKCECGTKYIGKTTRKFKQRFQEHKHSFIYNNPDRSKFAAHLLQEHHPLNFVLQ